MKPRILAEANFPAQVEPRCRRECLERRRPGHLRDSHALSHTIAICGVADFAYPLRWLATLSCRCRAYHANSRARLPCSSCWRFAGRWRCRLPPPLTRRRSTPAACAKRMPAIRTTAQATPSRPFATPAGGAMPYPTPAPTRRHRRLRFPSPFIAHTHWIKRSPGRLNLLPVCTPPALLHAPLRAHKSPLTTETQKPPWITQPACLGDIGALGAPVVSHMPWFFASFAVRV